MIDEKQSVIDALYISAVNREAKAILNFDRARLIRDSLFYRLRVCVSKCQVERERERERIKKSMERTEDYCEDFLNESPHKGSLNPVITFAKGKRDR